MKWSSTSVSISEPILRVISVLVSRFVCCYIVFDINISWCVNGSPAICQYT
jgi:hypothetical protein